MIRPGKEIPLDLRNHTAKHPEIGGQTCVVVEFDKTEDCQMAHKTLGKKAREDNNGWEYNLLGMISLNLWTITYGTLREWPESKTANKENEGQSSRLSWICWL